MKGKRQRGRKGRGRGRKDRGGKGERPQFDKGKGGGM